MAPRDDLRLLRELLESRLRGLRICNEALEGEVSQEMRTIMETLRDEDAWLISRLQRAIQRVMEGSC